jgi:hypothetical protein
MGADWYERNKDYQEANAGKHRDEYRQCAREYIWDYLSTWQTYVTTATGSDAPNLQLTVTSSGNHLRIRLGIIQ